MNSPFHKFPSNFKIILITKSNFLVVFFILMLKKNRKLQMCLKIMSIYFSKKHPQIAHNFFNLELNINQEKDKNKLMNIKLRPNKINILLCFIQQIIMVISCKLFF